MKPCNNCGAVKPDQEFAVDRTRDDQLALICRECNKQKCKQWYAENRARKQALSLGYKLLYGSTPPAESTRSTKPRVSRKAREIEEAASELKLVRFTAREWQFCADRAAVLGLKPENYVRILVQDALHRTQTTKSQETT